MTRHAGEGSRNGGGRTGGAAHLLSVARYQTLEISDCCRCCGVVFGACDALEYSTLSIMMPTDISALTYLGKSGDYGC